MHVSFPRSALLPLASGWTRPYRDRPNRSGATVHESPFHREERNG